MDGFQVARELQKLGLKTNIVILTMHKDEAHFNQAIDLQLAQQKQLAGQRTVKSEKPKFR